MKTFGVFVAGAASGILLIAAVLYGLSETAGFFISRSDGPVVQAKIKREHSSERARSATHHRSAAHKASQTAADARSSAEGSAGTAPDVQPDGVEDGGVSDDSEGDGCSDEYSGCVPAGEYDVDCGDLSDTDIEVLGYDEYALDRDGDGIACESY